MPDLLQQISEHFNLNRTERRGLVLLSALLIVVIVINLMLPWLLKQPAEDFTELEKELKAFLAKQKEAAASNKAGDKTNDQTAELTFEPFYFDPNTLPAEQWNGLGLNDKQVQVIRNYLSKGGRFNTADDLAKIYSLSADDYNRLRPWIVIKPKHDAAAREKRPLQPHEFDPNLVTYLEMIDMGFEEHQAKTLMNYREKGGFFTDAEDFRKLWFVNDSLFRIVSPFILIDEMASFDSLAFVSVFDTLLIDLNSADTLDLQQLKGIGPTYARRIVKYREMLGGYTHKEQLLEVYGMDSLRYSIIAENLDITGENLVRININEATIKDLVRHPYIEFYLAKSIITHREKIGKYSNLEEVLNAKLVYKELYEKIKPYLTI